MSQLNVRLDEIQRRFDAAQEDNLPGACEDIQNDSFPAVKRLIDGLPEDVDGKLRDATEESFARLQQLVDDGCQDLTPTETETTPTETVEPETVPPETTPPETTPTETTPPETTPQDETPPAGRRRQRRHRPRRHRRRRHPGPAGRRLMAAPGEIAGRYALDRRLGAGGMSTVFLATDEVLERSVAVKLLAEHLADDEDFVARFRREALAAARLQHPNVVQVFDSGLDGESHRHYIVMEFVDGPSAADMLREQKRLELDEALSVIRDACHGLDYAHRAGVVHRDVKPGNLLVAAESHTTKLADFGIAKASQQTRITQVGSVLGTAAYLSPEQARGEEAGPASDIYSLGVCAYQFLAGRLPHEYSSLTELALKQQEESVEPITVHRPEVPPELDRAIRVCLAREPEARYATTLEMAQALDAGLAAT